ncbi:MAG: AAA family ATPase [Treponema sp. CETP13]|nr:MAG: AAA family ATPase [Treponema sp. CETP13]
MTTSDIIKQLFISYNSQDTTTFENAARAYIEQEKRKKHNIVVKDLEKALFSIPKNSFTTSEKRFKNTLPIPRDTEKGFPLLEIQTFDKDYNSLLVSNEVKEQLDEILKEFKDADILATYNLQYNKKILLCGKPGTGKTFSAQIVSSMLNIPLLYIRFDSIISSYLGETAGNLRKVFDFIEQGTWIVLFDEFDIIGKNRDDSHEHGEIKRVVNNFLQMLDNLKGDSLIFAATNHQNILDPAIWRRFDEVIYYDLPNVETRKHLFKEYLKPIKREKDINFDTLATLSKGLSPADIKMIAESATKIAIINAKEAVSMIDVETAVKKFLRREKVKNNRMEEKNE